MLATVAVCMVAAGCMGSWAMRGTRIHYNKSISHTASQEMLLNIVRMRYGETPTFLDMPSVVSQSAVSTTGNGAQKSAYLGVVDGAFTLLDRPTISYSPRTGDDMAASMIKALRAEAILDVSPGNDTRMFLLAFVDSINGVRNSPHATSPASRIVDGNDEYRYAIDLFMDLQNRGADAGGRTRREAAGLAAAGQGSHDCRHVRRRRKRLRVPDGGRPGRVAQTVAISRHDGHA
jgi:hypothetical protein